MPAMTSLRTGVAMTVVAIAASVDAKAGSIRYVTTVIAASILRLFRQPICLYFRVERISLSSAPQDWQNSVPLKSVVAEI